MATVQPDPMPTPRPGACARCGWPEDQPFEVVSRHSTSTGTLVYTRCACGRLQVRRLGGAWPAPIACGAPPADG
ncbi:hypothetical protein [Allonocardiopsis opalescens]|nr:hypothetical protein [Allonocardiopsis opalescens]